MANEAFIVQEHIVRMAEEQAGYHGGSVNDYTLVYHEDGYGERRATFVQDENGRIRLSDMAMCNFIVTTNNQVSTSLTLEHRSGAIENNISLYDGNGPIRTAIPEIMQRENRQARRERLEHRSGLDVLKQYIPQADYSDDLVEWAAGIDSEGKDRYGVDPSWRYTPANARRAPDPRSEAIDRVAAQFRMMYENGIAFTVEKDRVPGQLKFKITDPNHNRIEGRVLDNDRNIRYAGSRVYNDGVVSYFSDKKKKPQNGKNSAQQDDAAILFNITPDMSKDLLAESLGLDLPSVSNLGRPGTDEEMLGSSPASYKTTNGAVTKTYSPGVYIYSQNNANLNSSVRFNSYRDDPNHDRAVVRAENYIRYARNAAVANFTDKMKLDALDFAAQQFADGTWNDRNNYPEFSSDSDLVADMQEDYFTKRCAIYEDKNLSDDERSVRLQEQTDIMHARINEIFGIDTEGEKTSINPVAIAAYMDNSGKRIINENSLANALRCINQYGDEYNRHVAENSFEPADNNSEKTIDELRLSGQDNTPVGQIAGYTSGGYNDSSSSYELTQFNNRLVQYTDSENNRNLLEPVRENYANQAEYDAARQDYDKLSDFWKGMGKTVQDSLERSGVKPSGIKVDENGVIHYEGKQRVGDPNATNVKSHFEAVYGDIGQVFEPDLRVLNDSDDNLQLDEKTAIDLMDLNAPNAVDHSPQKYEALKAQYAFHSVLRDKIMSDFSEKGISEGDLTALQVDEKGVVSYSYNNNGESRTVNCSLNAMNGCVRTNFASGENGYMVPGYSAYVRPVGNFNENKSRSLITNGNLNEDIYNSLTDIEKERYDAFKSRADAAGFNMTSFSIDDDYVVRFSGTDQNGRNFSNVTRDIGTYEDHAENFTARVRVRGYEQVMKNKISETIMHNMSQVGKTEDCRNRLMNASSLNSVYSHICSERLPEDFPNNLNRFAHIQTLLGAVTFDRDTVKKNATVVAVGENEKNRDDAKKIGAFNPIDEFGLPVMSSMPTGLQEGVFDSFLTGSGANAGNIRYLATGAKIGSDGSIEASDYKSNASPTLGLKEFENYSSNASTRLAMAGQNNAHQHSVIEVNVAHASFGGYTQDDANIISIDFARRNMVPGKNNLDRPLGIGDKLCDYSGNKGVISFVADPELVPYEGEYDRFEARINNKVENERAVREAAGQSFTDEEAAEYRKQIVEALDTHGFESYMQTSLDSERERRAAAGQSFTDDEVSAYKETVKAEIDAMMLDNRVQKRVDMEHAFRDAAGQSFTADEIADFENTVRSEIEAKKHYFDPQEIPDNASQTEKAAIEKKNRVKAEQKELCQVFHDNDTLDMCGSSFTLLSRQNAGTPMELLNSDEKNPLFIKDQAVFSGVSHCKMIITDKMADKKTNLPESKAYDENGEPAKDEDGNEITTKRNRNISNQLRLGLEELGCSEILKESFRVNSPAVRELREKLLVCGVDVKQDGTLIPGYEPHVIGYENTDSGREAKKEERPVFSVEDYTKAYVDGKMQDMVNLSDDAKKKQMTRLPNNAAKECSKEFEKIFDTNAGFVELPFEIKLGTGEKTNKLPILDPKYRSGRETVDGAQSMHEYTSAYMRMIDAASRYCTADDDKKRTEFAEAVQNGYDYIFRDIDEKNFEGKHNIFKEKVMRTELKGSATAVISPDPTLDLNEIMMSKEMAEQLGIDLDNPKVMAWRDPMLSGGGVRCFDVKIIETRPGYPGYDPYDPMNSLKGIAINPSAAVSFEGDFDGDTMGLYCPKSPAARKEMEDKLSVYANLLNKETANVHVKLDENGKPMIGSDGIYVLEQDEGKPLYNSYFQSKLDVGVGCHFSDEAKAAIDEGTRLANDAENISDSEEKKKMQLEALAKLNEGMHKAHDAAFGHSAISYDTSETYINSVSKTMVDGKGEGGKGKQSDFEYTINTYTTWKCERDPETGAITGFRDLAESNDPADRKELEARKLALDDANRSSALATGAKANLTGIAGVQQHYADMLTGLIKATELSANNSMHPLTTDEMLYHKHRSIDKDDISWADRAAAIEALTHPITQTVMQLKHDDAETIKRKVDLVENTIPDHWAGYKLKKDENGTWVKEVNIDENGFEKPVRCTKAEWINQTIDLYTDKNGLNCDMPNPKYIEIMAEMLSDEDGYINGYDKTKKADALKRSPTATGIADVPSFSAVASAADQGRNLYDGPNDVICPDIVRHNREVTKTGDGEYMSLERSKGRGNAIGGVGAISIDAIDNVLKSGTEITIIRADGLETTELPKRTVHVEATDKHGAYDREQAVGYTAMTAEQKADVARNAIIKHDEAVKAGEEPEYEGAEKTFVKKVREQVVARAGDPNVKTPDLDIYESVKKDIDAKVAEANEKAVNAVMSREVEYQADSNARHNAITFVARHCINEQLGVDDGVNGYSPTEKAYVDKIKSQSDMIKQFKEDRKSDPNASAPSVDISEYKECKQACDAYYNELAKNFVQAENKEAKLTPAAKAFSEKASENQAFASVIEKQREAEQARHDAQPERLQYIADRINSAESSYKATVDEEKRMLKIKNESTSELMRMNYDKNDNLRVVSCKSASGPEHSYNHKSNPVPESLASCCNNVRRKYEPEAKRIQYDRQIAEQPVSVPTQQAPTQQAPTQQAPTQQAPTSTYSSSEKAKALLNGLYAAKLKELMPEGSKMGSGSIKSDDGRSCPFVKITDPNGMSCAVLVDSDNKFVVKPFKTNTGSSELIDSVGKAVNDTNADIDKARKGASMDNVVASGVTIVSTPSTTYEPK